jgi:hypothetical protein
MRSSFERLIILDLNGFLIHRIHKRDAGKLDPDFLAAGKFSEPYYHWPRPHLCEFLQFLFQNNFTVAVWTSAQKRNARTMLKIIHDECSTTYPFLFVWNQSMCKTDTLSKKDWEKEQELPPKKRRRRKRWLFTKPLISVWDQFPQFDATNTLLIDDSPEKTAENPPGLHYCPPMWCPTNLNDYRTDQGLTCQAELQQWLKDLTNFSGTISEYNDTIDR